PAIPTTLFSTLSLHDALPIYDYLQLFDLPSPNISAEQRFTTNVPLQRLFFMNSDFVQQQAELLARKLDSEPSNTARVQQAYRLVDRKSTRLNSSHVKISYAVF